MIVKPEKKIAKAIWDDLLRREEFYSTVAETQRERSEEIRKDWEELIKKFLILR